MLAIWHIGLLVSRAVPARATHTPARATDFIWACALDAPTSSAAAKGIVRVLIGRDSIGELGMPPDPASGKMMCGCTLHVRASCSLAPATCFLPATPHPVTAGNPALGATLSELAAPPP